MRIHLINACAAMLVATVTILTGWALVNHTVWAFAVWAVVGPVLFWHMGIERGRSE